MDSKRIMAAGLDKDEAELYILLLERGPQTAGELLKSVDLKRSTLYQALRTLGTLGLVSESERHGKILFSPAHPDRLVALTQAKKDEAARAADDVRAQLGELTETYFISTEKPLIHYYRGTEGLKAIYERHLESGKDLWFLRAKEVYTYQETFGKWWIGYLRRRAKAGIRAYGLTPDAANANHDPKLDLTNNVVRTWMRPEDYDVPVEINVFGDTIAIISFGKDIFGLTLENPVLAEAFRQMLKLIKVGAEHRPPKHDHE